MVEWRLGTESMMMMKVIQVKFRKFMLSKKTKKFIRFLVHFEMHCHWWLHKRHQKCSLFIFWSHFNLSLFIMRFLIFPFEFQDIWSKFRRRNLRFSLEFYTICPTLEPFGVKTPEKPYYKACFKPACDVLENIYFLHNKLSGS